MDDNPYRSPVSAPGAPDEVPGQTRSRLTAAVRPAFMLAGGAVSTLYGVTLLTTLAPFPRSPIDLVVGLVLGSAATFGGAFLAIYSARTR
jgi:hypothetical protein